MPLCQKIFLFLSIWLFSFGSNQSNNVDPKEGERIVGQFVEFMNYYCTKGYDYGTQVLILSDICSDPQIKVTSDIPEMLGVETEMNTYLMDLKKYSSKGSIIIEYGKDIHVSKCYNGSSSFWGCQISKTIKSYKGSTKCVEIIQLVETNGSYKITGIRSDILISLEATCENTNSNTNSNSCKLMDLAESEMKENKVELAVAHYEQAKDCGDVESKQLASKIKEINFDSIYLSSFNKGILLFEQGKFTEALTYFESIEKAYRTMSSSFSSKLQNRIKQCRLEIDYFSIVKMADYYYEQGYSDKALSEYSRALKIKANDQILFRKNICEQNVQRQYLIKSKREIEEAESLILNSKEFVQGFSKLMKYIHSDLLSGLDYFLMAQIVNSPSNKTKKEFNLYDSRKRCLLTRQYLLNAHAMGYGSDGFNIYWNEYLDEKSRTCE